MSYKETNPNAIDKIYLLCGLGVPYKNTRSGIVIKDTIMIAKNHSKWKKLGSLDWYPYYGLKNLIRALYLNELDEYAEEQQSKTHRTERSVPINHSWKNKAEEKSMRKRYEGKRT